MKFCLVIFTNKMSSIVELKEKADKAAIAYQIARIIYQNNITSVEAERGYRTAMEAEQRAFSRYLFASYRV